MGQYGHIRVSITESNGNVVVVGPSTAATNTKAKGWADLRYIKIPFKAITDSKYVYRKGHSVPSIANLDTSGLNLWINGSYVYDATILGKTVVDEKIIFGDIANKTEKRKHFYFKDGIPNIGMLPSNLKGIKYAAQAGPLLLDAGKIVLTNSIEVDNFQTDIIDGRNNRTLLGITPDKHLVIVAVDGRGPTDAGLTLTQCAHLLKWLGCEKGLNMDGGGSGTLHTSDKTIQSYLNMKGVTHVSDTRGLGTRVISHGIGFGIDLNKLLLPYKTITATATAKIIDGVFHIPARSFVEALGGVVVSWDALTSTGTFKLGNKTLKITNDSDKMILSEE